MAALVSPGPWGHSGEPRKRCCVLIVILLRVWKKTQNPTSLYSKQAPKQRPLPRSPASQKRAMKSQYWNFSPTAFFSQEHVNYSDSRGLGVFFLIILLSSDPQRWYVSELWVLTVGPQSPQWFATCCGLLQWTGGQSLLWKNHTEPNRSRRQVQGEGVWGGLCLGSWRQPTMSACGGGTHLLPLKIISLCVTGTQNTVCLGPSYTIGKIQTGALTAWKETAILNPIPVKFNWWNMSMCFTVGRSICFVCFGLVFFFFLKRILLNSQTMKYKEVEINTVNIKSINVFLEAQSSELSFAGLTNSHLLKKTLKYDKMTLSSCFPLCACTACTKVVQNRAKLKYESRLG